MLNIITVHVNSLLTPDNSYLFQTSPTGLLVYFLIILPIH